LNRLPRFEMNAHVAQHLIPPACNPFKKKAVSNLSSYSWISSFMNQGLNFR
jgi:hypothetical protein